MRNQIKVFSALIIATGIMWSACHSKPTKLPIYGKSEIVDGDTIYHQIPDFSFINQDSMTVNNETFDGQMYVADFFFTSCPSICPKVAKQMLRIYDKYENEDLVKLVSHTIDPKRDNVQVLKNYAHNLGVSDKKWFFLTGKKDDLLGIADDYFVVAYEDSDVPGGFDHSGKILLVDKDRHVRAFCDGTDPESVTRFMKDIDILLDEYKNL